MISGETFPRRRSDLVRHLPPIRAFGAGLLVCLMLGAGADAAIDTPFLKATVSDIPRNYRAPAPPRFLERLPPLPAGHVVKVDLVLLDRTVEIQRGMRYRAWTFNGTIPGPVIHARVGDTIEVTLSNQAAM